MPAPLELKVTVPDGADLVPASVSVTVAVQELAWLIATEAGAQLTLVDVVRLVAVILKLPALAVCVPEPPYEPVIWWVPRPLVGV